ncbi:MAG: hypothetical protein US63_C0022G0007 [Candidatus Moranbacteria bacterium GW2011_GWC2_37_8]|nr:MAG: hypothetical protein US63_C0022G0007 [Candidatus Moranbacteria bacterium GW2011_GWC2_37_8]
MSEKIQVIYKLDKINPEDGVDIFEVAPILMSFGELIRSANDVLGYNQKINVRVKPFREGSWISEFILESSITGGVLTYLKGADGQNLLILLQLLGINVKDGAVGLLQLIRFTKGKIQNHHENKELGTFTYTNEKGENIEVSAPVHALAHSPLVQMNFYNVAASPLEKFPTAGSVSFQAVGSESIETVTEADKDYFEEYLKQELLTEIQTTEMNGVYVKPKRGSYSGEQRQYSFIFGESTLYPTAIEDEDFLKRLLSGEIRLFHEDLLKVDIEIRQRKDASNKILNQYAIKKVVEYIEYKKPDQGRLI